MKTLVKWIGRSVALILLLAVVALAQVVFFRPFSIDLFYEKVFIEIALKNPETLTSLRILEQFGIESHNGELTDASPAHTEEMSRLARQALEDLHTYDRSSLSETEQLSYDVLDYFLTLEVGGERFNYHNYPVNQLFGVQSSLPTFMATKHQIEDLQDAEYYIARLSQFDDKFAQVLEGLRLREERQIIPPRFVVEKVLSEMRTFIGTPVKENILYTSFVKRLSKIDQMPAGQKEALVQRVDDEINNTVYPAYGELIAYFGSLEYIAASNHGVWKLPDGEAFYAWKVREHTSTDMTPDEIYALGIREVARIEQKMDEILTTEGYRNGSVGDRMGTLAKDSRFLYEDSPTSREQILADYQAIIDKIDAGLAPYFDLRPDSGVEVKPIPSFKEKTAPIAYYNTPPMDGSRPGTFHVNLGDIQSIKKWGMNTIAYHEAIPGHHFQMTIAQELKGLPTFRNILGFTAYTEGWGLYAERLAKEAGFQEDPYNDLGRLQAEMWRAVRLVVDTGMHHKRWSREQAIDYMIEKTGIERDEVIVEIERYLVMPGQALAYKVGMEKILQLRTRARQALGDRFDIRQFHNVLLGSGSLPLFILEQQVNGYIEAHQEAETADKNT